MKLKSPSLSTKGILYYLALAALIAVSYTQLPLYSSNQNTKFFHGLMRAGRGLLHEDWMATTVDPLPAFSFLVQVTYGLLHESLFYLYFAVFIGVYLLSLLKIASLVFDIDGEKTEYVTFLAVVFLIHSKAVASISVRLTGHTPFNLLVDGLADQYLLGPVFQNSVFGVLMLLSMCLFLKKRAFWAAFFLGLTGIFHSAYLYGCALLTVSYVAVTFTEGKNWKRASLKAALIGFIALAMVLPVLWYSRQYLGSSSADAYRNSLDILVNKRIPHHSLPHVFMRASAYIQILVILYALFLVRRTRLFTIMVVPLLGGVVLTLVQIVTRSNSLALMAPWRVSVFLVPLSTFVVVAHTVKYLFRRFNRSLASKRRIIRQLSVAIIVLVVLGGVALQGWYAHERSSRPINGAMNYVKAAASTGDLFLIPPVDMQFEDFRLYTGAPTFVHWKTHPYRDTDVLEWYDRVQQAEAFFEAEAGDVDRLLKDLKAKYRISHIVTDLRKHPLHGSILREVYNDRFFAVYRIY